MYSKMQGVQTASAMHWCDVSTPPLLFAARAPPPRFALPLPFGPEVAENAAFEAPASGVEGAAAGEEEPEVEVEVEAASLELRTAVRCCAASSELTTSSSPGLTSRTRSKPRGPKAQSSEATHQSELPSAFSRALFFFFCGVRVFSKRKSELFSPFFSDLDQKTRRKKKLSPSLPHLSLPPNSICSHPSTSGLIPRGSLNATSPTPFTSATHE